MPPPIFLTNIVKEGIVGRGTCDNAPSTVIAGDVVRDSNLLDVGVQFDSLEIARERTVFYPTVFSVGKENSMAVVLQYQIVYRDVVAIYKSLGILRSIEEITRSELSFMQ